jgi:endonuclease/exonuclease/phosphatase family metal-dependent hydrolase
MRTKPTITVLSWNICWGLGTPKNTIDQLQRTLTYFHPPSTRKNLAIIAQAIAQAAPDIVALQEVDDGSKRNKHFNQVEALGDESGLKHSYFAFEKESLNHFRDGNAILSKRPLLQASHEMLPYVTEKRNYIVAEIMLAHETITVITTHLAAHRINAKERYTQAKELAATIATISTPLIVLGDFNWYETSRTYRELLEATSLKPLITKPTYPSFRPQQYFDNILVSDDFEVVSAGALDTKGSDHLPVVATLRLSTT